jgi:uncharacterized protein
MNSLFFGSSDQPLFGNYHPPASDQYQSSGILICSPMGHEYTKTHNALRSLAVKLSKQGYAVLRFDYYGIGDSSGKSDTGTIERWLNDIDTAVKELRDMSGEQKVNIIGLRSGALLAGHYAESKKIDQLLLWEPVTDGEKFIERLNIMQQDMLVDDNRFDYPISIKTENEFLGSPYSTELQQQLRDCSLNKLEKIKANAVHFISRDQMHLDELTASLNEKCKTTQCHHTEDGEDWNDIDRIEDILLASKSIQAICDIMSKNNG